MIEALVGFAAFFALALLRVPMGFAMGIVGFAGVAYKLNFNVAAAMIGQVTYETGLSYTLSVIPLFILMGNFVVHAPDVGRALSRRLLLPRPSPRRAGHVHGRGVRRLRRDLRLLDRDRRDLVQSRLSVDAQLRLQGHARRRLDRGRRHARHPDPALDHHGDLRDHDRDLDRPAVRSPASSRALIATVLLYARGAVDGLARPEAGPPAEPHPWPERLAALKHVWAVMALFVLVIGGIYSGAFTATEGAGVGAGGAFLFALARRALTWRVLLEVLSKARAPPRCCS